MEIFMSSRIEEVNSAEIRSKVAAIIVYLKKPISGSLPRRHSIVYADFKKKCHQYSCSLQIKNKNTSDWGRNQKIWKTRNVASKALKAGYQGNNRQTWETLKTSETRCHLANK